MNEDKVMMYHITKTEYNDGCCHQCDPSYGQPYSETCYVSDKKYAELMTNNRERKEITHVRKLTANENDAYKAGIEAQQVKSDTDMRQERRTANEHVRRILDVLGWSLREHGIELPWGVEFTFLISLNDVQKEIGDSYPYEVLDYLSDDDMYRMFKYGSTRSYTPKKNKQELVEASADIGEALSDWEIDVLDSLEEKEQDNEN